MAYSGPAVLPWLWHALVQDGEVVLLPQPIPHTAGPNGERGCRQPAKTAAVSWQQSVPATVSALACNIHLLVTFMTACWHT